MPSEQDQVLIVPPANQTVRPWQFSIRSVLWLMLTTCIVLTLVKLYGYEGFLLFLAVCSLGLFLYGILCRRVVAVIWSVLLFLFVALPVLFFLVLGLAIVYFVIGGLIIVGDWTLNRISSLLER